MREEALKRALVWLGAAGTLLFCLGPVVYMALIALAQSPDFLGPGRGFEPTLQHLAAVALRPSLHFWDYLGNSLIVSAASAGLCLLVAGPAAFALTRLDLPGRLVILLAILAVSMFPPVSLVSLLFKMMTALGWINTYPALVLPYVAWVLPLSLWILASYFGQIPRDLDRAALIDGCSSWQILRRVILPLAGPGLFSTGLLAFIFAFNEFLLALLLTTDHQARTIPVGAALFQGLHGETPWGEIMAFACLAVLPAIGLTVAFQRRVIHGLTRGAVRG